MSGLEERIEKAAAARQAEWAKGTQQDHARVESLTNELNTLWAEQRSGRTVQQHGERWHIVKRARVELELEKIGPEPNGSQDENPT